MSENERDDSDFLTALAIGAVVGIGAALLFRASDDLDREKIIKRLKPLKKKANRALHSASERVMHSASDRMERAQKQMNRKMSDMAGAGRIVSRSSGRIAHNVNDDLAKIMAQAGRDLEATARDSVKQARRAMRRAARRLV